MRLKDKVDTRAKVIINRVRAEWISRLRAEARASKRSSTVRYWRTASYHQLARECHSVRVELARAGLLEAFLS